MLESNLTSFPNPNDHLTNVDEDSGEAFYTPDSSPIWVCRESSPATYRHVVDRNAPRTPSPSDQPEELVSRHSSNQDRRTINPCVTCRLRTLYRRMRCEVKAGKLNNEDLSRIYELLELDEFSEDFNSI